MRRLMLALAGGTMLAASFPTMAQERRGDRQAERRDDGRDDRRRDRDRRDRKRGESTAGGFVLGALAVGLVAALSSRRAPPAPEVIADADDVPAAAAETDADAAMSACAFAVEGEGRRTYALAQIGTVRPPTPFEQGYALEGDVLLRADWQDAGEQRGFRCTVDAQAVRTVAIDGLVMLPPQP